MSRIARASNTDAAQHKAPSGSFPRIGIGGHVDPEKLQGVTLEVRTKYAAWLKRRGLSEEPTPSNLGRSE